MKWLLVPVLCCCLLDTYSQSRFNYSLEWMDGYLVLKNKDSIACKLRYNQSLPEGILQVLDGENIRYLSAKEVKTFAYQDVHRKRLRIFDSMEMPAGQFEGLMYFCERLYSNSRFAIIKHRAFGTPYEYMSYSRFVRRQVVFSQKFILDAATGRLLPMCRTNALQLMEEKRPQITEFIHDQGIKFKTVDDYIRVFEYHASL